MKYLSVDPGTQKIGVAVWEITDGELRLIYSAPYTLRNKDLGVRYNDLYDTIVGDISTYRPEHLVCEAGFVGPNRATSLILAGSRAIVHMAANRHKVTYSELTPATVKKLATGKGNAKKLDVRKAMHALCSDWWLRTEDEADAIAIGYAYGLILGGKLCN